MAGGIAKGEISGVAKLASEGWLVGLVGRMVNKTGRERSGGNPRLEFVMNLPDRHRVRSTVDDFRDFDRLIFRKNAVVFAFRTPHEGEVRDGIAVGVAERAAARHKENRNDGSCRLQVCRIVPRL